MLEGYLNTLHVGSLEYLCIGQFVLSFNVQWISEEPHVVKVQPPSMSAGNNPFFSRIKQRE